MSEAKLVSKNQYGQELRRAARATDCWPGYDSSCPLGKRRLWFGNHRIHQLVRKEELRDLEISL